MLAEKILVDDQMLADAKGAVNGSKWSAWG
jgi:hypothetical protein